MDPLIRSARLAKDALVLPAGKSTPAPVSYTKTAHEEEEHLGLEERHEDRMVSEPEAAPVGDTEVLQAESFAPDEAEPVVDVEAEREAALQSEIERLRERAQEEGRAEGYQAGLAEAEAELAEARARAKEQAKALEKLCESATAALQSEIAQAEDDAVAIVFEAIAKLLGDALATKEAAIAAVRAVIEQVQERRHLVLRVAPADFALLAEHKSRLVSEQEGSVEVVADDRVALGGCLLETGSGSLDGRLEIQLQQLREVLLNARARRE